MINPTNLMIPVTEGLKVTMANLNHQAYLYFLQSDLVNSQTLLYKESEWMVSWVDY